MTMIKTILILAITLLTFQSYGQTSIQTKEIRIPYTNGLEVFKVCVSNCNTTFDDKKEYFWYTEFSNIKSTKGGSGGDLLHGNYKFYDENGNLRQEKDYYLGLPNGSGKTWDSIGNIISQTKYSNGDIIYLKFNNEEGEWIEHICVNGKKGFLMSKGWVKKIYSEYNRLLSEQTFLAFDSAHVKNYFESGNLSKEYTSYSLNYMAGKYTSYYENGKIKAEGQFYEGKTYLNIQIGTWKYYNSDGTLEGTQKFKENIELWDNGNKKVIGGYILYGDNQTWLQTGEWRWYDEDGKLQSSKRYEGGIERN